MGRRYLPTFAVGILCPPLSLPLSLYFQRIEPLVPLLSAGPSLIILSINWKGLVDDKNPRFVKAEKFIRPSIYVLGAGSIINILAATLGTALKTGFSSWYAASLIIGLFLPLIGSVLTILGLRASRKSDEKS